MREFLWGASAMGALVIGLFFLRFWTTTRDRLFALFALAFTVLALNWALLALHVPSDEARHYVYAVRLVAFALIAVAIVDKNRRT